MATLQAVFIPAKKVPTKITALGATTASSTLTFNQNAIIAVEASGAVNIIFGNAGTIGTADATGWLIQAGAVAEFDLGQWDSVAIGIPVLRPSTSTSCNWVERRMGRGGANNSDIGKAVNRLRRGNTYHATPPQSASSRPSRG